MQGHYIIIFITACEIPVGDDVFIRESHICVNGVVSTEDTVKIFVGKTSGMNSGDIAEYIDDAKVELFINIATNPVLHNLKKLII